MNKKVFTFCLALLCAGFAYSQQTPVFANDSVKRYVDTILMLTRQQSLFRANVNWATVKDSVYNKAAGAKSWPQAMPAIQYLFNTMGDKHAGIVYNGRWSTHNTSAKPYSIRQPLLHKLQAGPVAVQAAVFGGEYGYIRIPGINATGPDEIMVYAQQIQDSVCKINAPRIKGWIIDLRLNGGGNMYPMLAGIGNIIGDGKLGAFINPDGSKVTDWELKDGAVYVYGYVNASLKNKCSMDSNIKVAVLLSQVTASSGEVVAIAMKGRPNTRFFGEKTAGYVTANGWFQLDNATTLLFSTNYEADRTGHIYKDLVAPDELMVDGDDFDDLTKDAKVKAALDWLSGQGQRH